MDFNPQERIGLFIDGANLYAAARSLGFDIDYKRLREEFAGKARLIRALYYTALIEDQEYSPIRPLVDWLDYNGYTLITKPTKEFTDSLGRRKVKGDMDIEIAVDMMELADVLDHIEKTIRFGDVSAPPEGQIQLDSLLLEKVGQRVVIGFDVLAQCGSHHTKRERKETQSAQDASIHWDDLS